VERLSAERDAYLIPEIFAFVLRETSMDRRHAFAASIRMWLDEPATRIVANAEELEALASELDDERNDIDPECAIACKRLVTDVSTSALLNPMLRREDLHSQIARIRLGLRRR
jgi:hypothetical protein